MKFHPPRWYNVRMQPGVFVCRDTGGRYDLHQPIWRSPASAGLLDLEWPSRFPIDEIQKRPATLWRYREALPIRSDTHIVSLGEPMTPLLRWDVAGREVTLKLDIGFASGSYKDRGAAILIAHCRALGIQHVVEDSSGNAGAAIAMYCAAAGIACDIYVPESASTAKLVQVSAGGAKMVRVPGTRQDTSDAVWSAAQHSYYASHVWNPLFFHGTKTFVFELVEQLGWHVPDAIVIPTGNGTLLIGAYIGLRELQAAGVIDRLPKLIAVQAANCAPLAGSSDVESTIAEGIAIPRPMRAAQCREAIDATGGAVITLTEDEIRSALINALGRGLFIEPTCATALAAVAKLDRSMSNVVLAITGHGLKAAGAIAKLCDLAGLL